MLLISNAMKNSRQQLTEHYEDNIRRIPAGSLFLKSISLVEYNLIMVILLRKVKD